MTIPLDILTIRAAYASGICDPPTMLETIFDRIERNLRPVWITATPRDRAREQLAQARARAENGEPQPLLGIPFAVKDNIDVAGLPTTAACPDFAYIPNRSAAAVARLEQAGAICMGKTNLDQFATGLVGTRSPYGACSSVFDDAYVSGGSSSGSAIAVAAGLVSFALGTDTAGSGRVPAAFNNIVGLKPTRGLVSSRGVVPACRTLDCVSVFASTVGDATDVLSIIAGFDAADPFSRPAAPSRGFDGNEFRFGVPKTLPVAFGHADAERLFAATADRLVALGGRPVSFDLAPYLRAGALLYGGPFVAERLAALRAYGFAQWDRMDPVVAEIIRSAGSLHAAEAFTGFYALAVVARETSWEQFDVMLLPTVPHHPTLAAIAADPVGGNAALGVYSTFTNLLDHCAIAVPAGMQANGLPFGVTLSARDFADASLASLAARLHDAVDGTIGGTDWKVPSRAVTVTQSGRILLAVVGAHLSGEALNHQLSSRGARLRRTARTAVGYRLFALAGDGVARPGLLRDPSGAGNVEIELWDLDPSAFGDFISQIPAPLTIGIVAINDGSKAKGFLCESEATNGAEDITAWGGWRAWRAACS